jgi:DNA replication licensing factor MCM5
MGDNCEYIDQQTLKLQESPEVVPTGEMPRNIMVSMDRYLVDKVTPGTRISVIGITSLYNVAGRGRGNNAQRSLFIKALGIHVEFEGGGRTSTVFTPQEEEEMQRLARDPEIYEKVARSIAPQISGEYTHDIKKALALLLMGGSRKVLPDGVRLRGDINVLLMGDPSTAKSQFLKFIERVAPIGVYTSGKGSSAAGLTASVIKDAKGEFYLEGGAMVLADGGVICIDEVSSCAALVSVSIFLSDSYSYSCLCFCSSTRCARQTAWPFTKPWSSRPFPSPKPASPRCSTVAPLFWPPRTRSMVATMI